MVQGEARVNYEVSINVQASPAAVWAATTDVESWPQWTPSVTSARRLDEGPFRLGSQARVKQPKLATMTWTVTELDPERSFTWVARSPGLEVTGVHAVQPLSNGGARLTLGVSASGPLAGVVGLFLDRRTRRYVDLEAQGTKRAAEALEPAPTA